MQVNLLHIWKNYLKWIVIFAFQFAITVNAFSEEVDCFYKSCYYLDNSLRTWEEAETLCRNQSGHLVHILDKFEQTFIENRMRSQNDFYWIGLTDGYSSGSLSWINGDPVTFTKWDVQQPVSGIDKLTKVNTEKQCVSITTGSLSGFWRVGVCKEYHFSICEVSRKLVEEKLSEAVNPNGCVDTWTYFSPFCYKIFNSDSLNWFDAQNYCEKIGGNLASFHAQQEANSVLDTGYFDQEKWIGLNRYNTSEGHHIWSDNSAVIFTNWHEGEPNNHGEREFCVVASKKAGNDESIPNWGWDDRNCNLKKSFICKIHSGVAPGSLQPSEMSVVEVNLCQDPSWKYFNNSCFLYKSGYSSWQQSREFCRQNNSELASIHSVEELEFVYNLFSDLRTGRLWIGLSNLFSDDFRWSNNKPVTFSLWGTGEPNNAFIGEKCTTMDARTGNWYDINCAFKSGYICRKNLTPEPLPVIKELTEKCPPEWYDADHRCYKIFWKTEHRKTWNEALEFCRGMGKDHDLASIQDSNEQDFLITLMKDYKVDMWIGKIYLEATYTWDYWTDNSDGTYTYWDFGQPRMGLYSSQMYHGRFRSFPGPIYRRRRPFGRRRPPFGELIDTRQLSPFKPMRPFPFFPLPPRLPPYYSRYNGRQRNRMAPYLSPDEDPDEEERIGNCTMMRSSGHHAGKWSTHNCSDLLSFICERSRGPQPSKLSFEDAAPLPPKVICPYDYKPYADACFKLVLTPKTWVDADIECKKESAELASINNVYESAFTRVLSRQHNVSAWIGLTNNKNAKVFEWSDGWPLLYQEWSSSYNYYIQDEKRKDCVVIYEKYEWDHGWNATDCSQQYPFICKQTKVKPPPLPTPSVGECPKDDSDWLDTGSNCFLVKPNEISYSRYGAWGMANGQCKFLGLELASFDNEAEYNYVKEYVNEITSDFLWIGLYKTIAGEFVWSDKSEVTFLEWANHYPVPNSNNSEYSYSLSQDTGCVVIDSLGKWRNIYCDHNLGFICKMSKTMTTKPPSTDKPTKPTVTSVVRKTITPPALRNTTQAALQLKKEDSTLSAGSIFGICIGVLLSLVFITIGVLAYQKRNILPSFMENPRTFMQTLCHSTDDDIDRLPDNMEHPK